LPAIAAFVVLVSVAERITVDPANPAAGATASTDVALWMMTVNHKDDVSATLYFLHRTIILL